MATGLLQDPPAPGGPAPAATDRPPLLLGDEAVALAAVHAGIASAYAYPGTPSTEIFEAVLPVADELGITAHWCTNEKTAYEQALGASMVGMRTLVTMKHVGLNVAMDPFVNSALVRIHGGLVLVVADDPGMHSSQNEQDSRVLADFARVPCLEPATQQEAYDMTRAAFGLSEHFNVPVVVRLVTRICHGRAEVVGAAPEPRARARKPGDPRDWTLLPGNARRLWQALLDAQPAVRAWVEESPWVRTERRGERFPLGVVTAGIARNYLEEVLPELDAPVAHVHVGAYPAPDHALRALAEQVDRILVLEEGYPFLEGRLRGVFGAPVPIQGKTTGDVPLAGELTPDAVRTALGLPQRPQVAPPMALPARPPQLCPGCPHRDAFAAIRSALDGYDGAVAAGDIGCYTLGALPPYGALESCVCMGASVGMAKGASDAGAGPALAIVGDSTFLHSGLTGLADAVAHDSDMTLVILDNSTVAMTGQQPTALPNGRLAPILSGMGVDPDHLHVVAVHPRKTDELAALVRRELEHHGLSVIVAERACIEAARKEKKARRAENGGGG
jgi:indolepyruvate ferredoxin oxidoreductase alpha subunit